MDASRQQARVEGCAQEAARTERIRMMVWSLPLLGLLLAALLQRIHPLLGAFAIAAATLGFLYGMYRTSLQRIEAQGRLDAARSALVSSR